MTLEKGGGAYPSRFMAADMARVMLGNSLAIEGKDFSVHPSNTNPKVWVFEIPPRTDKPSGT